MSLREFITGLGSGQPESRSAAFRAMKRGPGVAALNGKVYAIGGRTLAGCVRRHTRHLPRASPELQNDRRHCPFRSARIRTNRLWLIPHGATAVDGAYVNFQSETMFRLIALES